MTVLTAEGLTRRYGDVVAADRIDLEAAPGSVLALIGPNGAGKTTTLGMVSGDTRPDSGRVLWDGEPIPPEVLRRRVGLASQQPQVWGRLTCHEQVRHLGLLAGLPRRVASRRADDLLEQVGLASRRSSQARILSGGTQRRLHLALALIADPPVVVLDEPGAGLDPQSRVLVRGVIAELALTRVVIVSSHDLAEIERLADRIVILDHGRVLASGTEAELRQAHGPAAVVEVTTTADAAGTLAQRWASVADDLTVDGGTVSCRARGGLADVLAAAATAGVPLLAVHTRESSLEDVFLRLTGRRLRE